MKNFILRALTAIGIVAVQVLCTYFSPFSLSGLFMLFTALAVSEFIKIVSEGGEVSVSRPIVIVGSCYLFFAFCINSLTQNKSLILFVPYLIFLLYHYIKELYSEHDNPIANLGVIMLSQLYVVLPLSLINVLAFTSFSCFSAKADFFALPLSMYIFIWINDTAAYLKKKSVHTKHILPVGLYKSLDIDHLQTKRAAPTHLLAQPIVLLRSCITRAIFRPSKPEKPQHT